MRILLVWLINALSLLAVHYVLPSVSVDSFYIALLTALLLGLVNTLIRPLLVLITLPLTILTLGLFTLVINGLLFWFVAEERDLLHDDEDKAETLAHWNLDEVALFEFCATLRRFGRLFSDGRIVTSHVLDSAAELTAPVIG